MMCTRYASFFLFHFFLCLLDSIPDLLSVSDHYDEGPHPSLIPGF